jgi:hypothetical protein
MYASVVWTWTNLLIVVIIIIIIIIIDSGLKEVSARSTEYM